MGPLHAKAVTNTIEYNIQMSAVLGQEPSDEAIEAFILETLSKGQVVPGFGHPVLRGKDSRLEYISGFMKTHEVSKTPGKGGNSGLSLKTMERALVIIPKLLILHVPRMRNPAPNMDALSGCMMLSYGLAADATVLFAGCGRGMGISAQIVWDRGKCFSVGFWNHL